MASWKQRLARRVRRVRERRPALDHLIRMVGHYNGVGGNAQAGAVTFFGFVSFFPILALAFFVVGLLAHVYPDLRNDVHGAIDQLLPGVIGNGQGEIPMSTFESAAGTVGAVGLVGVLYSGLGWLSGMRQALEVMFKVPKREQPNLLVGKARDLGTLLLIGVMLLVSVMLSAAVAGFSAVILRWLGVDPHSVGANVVLWLVAHGLAVSASAAVLLGMFKLLVEPHLPRHSLLEGALLGAVGFELLKILANFLLGQTRDQPAFQAFGVALILVVWINYFSRLVMYAAAYAYTAPAARARRATEAVRAPGAALAAGGSRLEAAAEEARDGAGSGPHGRVAAGAAVGLGVAGAAMLRRRRG
ncbi:MAG: YihY/virulence factor BrkB family protein [Nocardioidaceae bacterium]